MKLLINGTFMISRNPSGKDDVNSLIAALHCLKLCFQTDTDARYDIYSNVNYIHHNDRESYRQGRKK